MEKVFPDKEGVSVYLDQSLECDIDRIQPQRGATLGYKWRVGDSVHVLEKNGKVFGWWEATLVKPTKYRGRNGWMVKWTGQYEDHGDEQFVRTENLRKAKV